jgi:hypothetical protein
MFGDVRLDQLSRKDRQTNQKVEAREVAGTTREPIEIS